MYFREFFMKNHRVLLSLAALVLLSACDVLTPGLGDNVDINPPEVTITSPKSSPLEYISGDVVITGTAKDDIKIDSVIVSWENSSIKTGVRNNTWEVTIPIEEITQRKTLLFEAVAVDAAGKNSSKAQVTVFIDDKAPTVIITAPQSYDPGPENSNYINIEGMAWDESPISEVRVSLYSPDDLSTPLYTKIADGNNSWAARIVLDDLNLSRTEAVSLVYMVRAVDAGGMENSYVYHAQDFWAHLPTGLLFPSAKEIGEWDQYGDSINLGAGVSENPFSPSDQGQMQITNTFPRVLGFSYNADTDKPVITLSSLDPNKAVSENAIGQNVPIYVSATDDKEGINPDSVTLTITGDNTSLTLEGSNFNSPGNGTYTSFDFDLSGENILAPGQYSALLTLADKKGTESSLAFSFLVNKGAPVIVSVTPSSTYAGVDASGRLITDVVIKDDNPGSELIFTVKDLSGNILEDVAKEVVVPEEVISENGENYYIATHRGILSGVIPDELTLEISVVDASGLKNTLSKQVTVDRDAPTMNLTVPGAGDVISGNALTAAGTASDLSSDVYQVFLSLHEGLLTTLPEGAVWSAAKGNNTWSLPQDLSAFAEGPLTLFSYPTDIAGNQGALSSVHFYYDLNVPEITLDQGTQKEYRTDDYSLTGEVTDSNGLSLLDLQVSRDGGSFASLSGYPVTVFADSQSHQWDYTHDILLSGEDDGQYEYKVILQDVAGKEATLSKIINIDTQAPELIVSNLEDGNSVNTSEYTIKGIASDATGIASVEYLLNDLPSNPGALWQPLTVESTGNWTLAVSSLEEGSGNTLTLRAEDVVGQSVETSTIHFGLDLNPPALSVANRGDYEDQFVGGNFTLNGTASDPNGIDKLELSTDGGVTWSTMEVSPGVPYQSSDNSTLNWTVDVPVAPGGEEDGNHVVQVRAIDSYQKETKEFFTVKFDASGPDLAVGNISNGFHIDTTPFRVKGSASDNGGSGLAQILYSLDGTNWTPLDGTGSWTGDIPLSTGLAQDIHFKGVDLLGHESAIETISVNVDFSDPSSTGDWSNKDYHQSLFTLSGTATDDTGIKSISIEAMGDNSATAGLDVLGLTGAEGDLSRDWSIDIEPTVDGEYEFRVTLEDMVGQTREYTKYVAMDTTKPVLSNLNIQDGDFVSSATFKITGVAEDDFGIAQVRYNLNGAGWQSASGSPISNWFVEVAGLNEGGSNNIVFQATDNTGWDSDLLSLTFGMDTQDPDLTESGSGIADANLVNKNSDVVFSGTAVDEAGIDHVYVVYSKDGGGEIEILDDTTDDGSWTVTLPQSLGDGVYDVGITAVDGFGKTTAVSRKIRFDSSAPILTITTPSDDENVLNPGYTARGTVTDNGGVGVTILEYSIDGGSNWINVENNAFNWSQSGLDFTTVDGPKTLDVRASDGLNGFVYEQVNFYHDNTPPSLGITPLGLFTNGAFTLEGTAQDVIYLEDLRISATRNGTSADLNGASAGTDLLYTYGSVNTEEAFTRTFIPGTNITDGEWVFSITATDGAGNFDRQSVSIEVDSTDPGLPVITSTPGDYLENQLNLAGTASDGGTGVGAVLYSLNFTDDGDDTNDTWVVLNGTDSWLGNIDVSSLGEGAHSVFIKSRDLAGNESGVISQNFTVDRNNPVLSVNGTWGPGVYRTAGFTLTGTTSDSNGIGVVEVSGGGAGAVTGTTTWSIPVNPSSEGENTLSLTVTDGVGRTSTQEVEYFYDISEPTISGINLNNGDLIGTNTYTVVGQASDGAGSGIASVEYNLNNSGWTTSGLSGTDTWNIMLTGLVDQQNQTLAFRGTDRAGNVMGTPITRTFTVDTATPEIKPEIIADRQAPYGFEADTGTVTVTTNQAYGGSSSLFVLEVLATDSNGLASVTINIPGLGDISAVDTGDTQSGYSVWRTPVGSPIDTSGLPDGTTEWTITVEDTSGLTSVEKRTVLIDNSAPAITHFSPRSSLDIVNGEIEVKGQATDTGAGVSSVRYKVGYNPDSQVWQDVSGSPYNWEIPFTGANKIDRYAGLTVEAVDEVNDEITLSNHGYAQDTPVWIGGEGSLYGLNPSSDYYILNTGTDTFQLSLTQGGAPVNLTGGGTELLISAYGQDKDNDLIWEVPVLIRAEDSAGNYIEETPSDYVLKVDPSGDKPRATIVYPDPENTNRVMGGIIRIFGTAEDDDAVDSVYIQVDVNNDGVIDASDIDTQGVNWYAGGEGQLVTGTVSWNKSINTSGEFNPQPISPNTVTVGDSYRITLAGNTDFVAMGAPDNVVGTEFTATSTGTGTGELEPLTRTIAFRVRVEDINGLFGPWTDLQIIEVDKNVPKIGSSQSITLESQSDPTATMAYVQDVWIKDDWNLKGTVEDESGISQITLEGDINGSYTGGEIDASPMFSPFTGAGTEGYEVSIPIDTLDNQTGTLEFTLTVYDNNTPQMSNSTTFSINYDNKAPVLTAYAGTTPVEQSNKVYTLSSTVNEDGSGLERVAFYFKRDINGDDVDSNDYLYNPMETRVGDANRSNYSDLTMIDGLPRLELTSVTRNGDPYGLSHGDIVNNKNIRKGGLVKIGGIDRIIETIDYASGTITWADAVDTSLVDASVAYALVVDNDRIETPIWNGSTLESITNDDGDLLIESIEKAGGAYDWSASIDSHNIPDGPIEIHWVAFDKSGNAAAGVVDTQVLNNRPQMAKVILGTDLNGDNDTDDTGEKVNAYSLLDGAGENQAVATADSGAFVAKGLTTMEIDVVGGNGQLVYDLVYGPGADGVYRLEGAMVDPDEDDLILDSTDPGDNSFDTPNSSTQWVLRDTEGSLVNPIIISPYDWSHSGFVDGPQELRVYIWDNTEETTPRVDSQWAYLTLPMTLDLVDEVGPKSVIDPFYWTSDSDNSLYGNSRDNGHIEITGVLDGGDPDVSGQISIRGTAYDDQRIDEIYIYIDGMSIANGTTSTWDSRNYERAATYSGGTWTGTDQWGDAGEGWAFSAEDISIGQEGHQVTWQLDWDTARHNDVASLNQSVRIVTVDKGGNASSFNLNSNPGDVTLNNVPSYQMDVVPYITGVERNSTYNTHRSRSGFVSLMRGEANNRIYGFNLGTNGSLVMDVNKNGAYSGNETAITGYTLGTDGVTGKDYLDFGVPGGTRSGWLRLVVNSVEAVNNLNTNTLEYNSEANPFLEETEYWNDDRYIRIWQSNAGDVFPGSANPIFPAMGMNGGGTLIASFSNYSTARVYASTMGGGATDVFYTYDPSEETEIIVSDAGDINVLYSANYHGGNANDWEPNVGSAGGLYLYDNDAPTLYAGREWIQTYRFELFYHNQMLQQFKNIRGARGNNNIIHTAYYDRLSNSVKYSNVLDGYNPPGNNDDTHEIYWVNLDGGSDGDDTGTYTGGTSVVLGNTQFEGGITRSTGTDEYLSIALDEENLPVVVYLDAGSSELRLARANNTDPQTEGAWKVQTILGTEDPNYALARDYFSAKIDTNGYLHIAFRNSKGELCYVKSTNDPDGGAAYTFSDSVVLDTDGLWADITLRGTTPYISYLSKVNAYDGVKIAFYDATLDLDGDGTEEGGWETMTAAMNYKAGNVRTSIEAHPNGTGTNWTAAVGYTPGNEYRVVYYIDE